MSERPNTEPELVELIRSIDARAPDALYHRVQAMVDASTARRRKPVLVLGTSVACAAVLIVLAVLVLGGGGSSARLTVSQASRLTLRAASAPAPAESPSAHGQLTAAVDGLAFPYWKDAFGYRASGSRTDRVAGQTVTTVFYTNRAGQRIGYAIAASGAAPSTSAGRVVWREGTPYRVLGERGLTVVAWMRSGHLCVLTARSVPSRELVELASWRAAPA